MAVLAEQAARCITKRRFTLLIRQNHAMFVKHEQRFRGEFHDAAIPALGGFQRILSLLQDQRLIFQLPSLPAGLL
ncbi:hypothetical protein D9M71_821670 [compost metagenome]